MRKVCVLGCLFMLTLCFANVAWANYIDLINNGGFESDLGSWVASEDGTAVSVQSTMVSSGSFAAVFTSVVNTPASLVTGSLTQTLLLPDPAGAFSFVVLLALSESPLAYEGAFFLDVETPSGWTQLTRVPFSDLRAYVGVFEGLGCDTILYESVHVSAISFGFEWFTPSSPDPTPLAIYVDDVALYRGTAKIPEPTTMLFLGSGLLGLAGYGRKKFLKK